jgi:ABC-type cobalamin/Fe3+-siderophores transport system ATPase subunit
VLAAQALVQEPRVLVLDEPTNHLDIRHQIELLSLLRGSGTTVLLVLHELNFARPPATGSECSTRALWSQSASRDRC